MRQLADVILDLGHGRSGGRIYVAKPCTPNSRAVLHDLASAVDPPTGLAPLIDADLAFEYVRSWTSWQPAPPSPVAAATALLRFAQAPGLRSGQSMGDSNAGLRVTTSSGLTYDDPSEGLIHQLMLQVHAGEETFFIIERLADPTGQTYVQVLRDVDRTFVIEQRDGSEATHRSRAVVKMAAAQSLLIDWAFHELDVVPARAR